MLSRRNLLAKGLKLRNGAVPSGPSGRARGCLSASGENSAIEVRDLLTIDEAARFFGRDDPKLLQLVIRVGWWQPLLVLQPAYYDKHGQFMENGKPLFHDPPVVV